MQSHEGLSVCGSIKVVGCDVVECIRVRLEFSERKSVLNDAESKGSVCWSWGGAADGRDEAWVRGWF